MKRLIIIPCLLLVTFTHGQRFYGGLMGGLNVCQIDGDSWSGYNKAGFMAGAFVSTDFIDNWGGQLEVRYSGKGSATSKDDFMNRKIRFNYVEVPVLANYTIKEKFVAQAGVSVGYLFDSQMYDGTWYDFDEPNNEFEFALAAGVNYKMTQRLGFNIRFAYSLFPVRSRYVGSSWGDGAWYNNVWTFGIYYQIGG